MKKEYPDGLIVGDDCEETTDKVITIYSSSYFSLLSTDKLEVSNTLLTKNDNGYFQIFAGHGSPVIDNIFAHFNGVEGHDLHYKFCSSIEYSQYVPLSIGMGGELISTFKNLKISNRFNFA